MTEQKKVDETVEKTERHVVTGDDQETGTQTSAEKQAPDASGAAGDSAKQDQGSDNSDKGDNKSE